MGVCKGQNPHKFLAHEPLETKATINSCVQSVNQIVIGEDLFGERSSLTQCLGSEPRLTYLYMLYK